MGKKALCLIFAFLLSINSFAAIVSDNDGAAFVTKAEFEAMKKDFDAQITNYNNSIDNKIDGAIASYLAGTLLEKKENVATFLSGNVYAFEAANTASGRMRYVYNPPAFIGDARTAEWSDRAGYGNAAMYEIRFASTNHNRKQWWQTKLVIDHIDTTNRLAAWKGRYTKAYDEIDVTYTSLSFTETNWGIPQAVTQVIKTDQECNYNTRVLTNQDLYSKGLLQCYTAPSINNTGNNILYFYLNRVLNNWGDKHNENVILVGNTYNYDCFSNYSENRNWKYNGTSESLKQTFGTKTDTMRGIADGLFYDNTALSGTFANGHTVTDRVPIGSGTKSDFTTTVSGQIFSPTSGREGNRWEVGDTWLWPLIGFETNYINNWNQLYLPNLDRVAEVMVADSIKGYTSLKQTSDGKYHVPITAGIPLVQVKNENKVEMSFEVHAYSLDTNANSTTYGQETLTIPSRTYIWAKTSPFTTNDPNSEADITISTGAGVYKSTDSAYNKGVYITSSTATLKFDEINEASYIWLKWSCNNKVGNGVVNIPETVIVSQVG